MKLEDIRTPNIPRALLSQYMNEHSYISGSLKNELSDAVKVVMGEDVNSSVYIDMLLSRENSLNIYVKKRYFYDMILRENDPENMDEGSMTPAEFHTHESEWLNALKCIKGLKEPKSYCQDLRDIGETLKDIIDMEKTLEKVIADEEFEYAAELSKEIKEAREKLKVWGNI